jgi:hypothetical protein
MAKFTSSNTSSLQPLSCVNGEFLVVGNSGVALLGVRARTSDPEGLVRRNHALVRLPPNGRRSMPAWARRSDAAAWPLIAGGFAHRRRLEAP